MIFCDVNAHFDFYDSERTLKIIIIFFIFFGQNVKSSRLVKIEMKSLNKLF